MDLVSAIDSSCKTKTVGLRPGEKIHECMINNAEIANCYECDNFFIILSRTVSHIATHFENYILCATRDTPPAHPSTSNLNKEASRTRPTDQQTNKATKQQTNKQKKQQTFRPTNVGPAECA